ncbi:MAG: hypothetical protein UV58_C0007G0035 [Candidatus Wolfebacteria bacterium GW2011_GWC1_43_10]|uniref:Fimbrial assembly family protein n=2 Tax=Candidatus Wolfeibacteriota TaxID=1752735 RepID=A0A0G1CBB2_9BACT|nr:MAG: hypothetical protein UV58_C0007G0035 [Candidatus Wolfebacteria bacterium GW2011_GWC1_43_10]KKT22514.1 MAG: hypothetical protein UW08_C0007G0010 [Parcubacteria group bacterium GW2011_GWB1_43_8b]OGM89524.1 MAG: hypothetical protein A2108_03150 [Candidatus Wolfebacteria bacterium GWA1_42_9]
MADLNFSSVTPRSHKEEVSSVGFPWRIFVIALVVFGLTLVLWAGMSFGYTPYIKSEIKKVEAELDTLSTTFDESQQKDFISFYSQLYNIRNLSATHTYPSKIFDFIESSIYPTVRLSNLQVNLASGETRIEGIAVDYETLANQISALKNNTSVESVSLDTSRKAEAKDGGGTFFSLKIILNKKFLISS